MNQADEFSKWLKIFEAADDEATSDLAWRSMLACVDNMEQAAPDDKDEVSIGAGVAWAGFWIAVGAVLVPLIAKI